MNIVAPDDCFLLSVPCVCYAHSECQCAREERVLRHVAAGNSYPAFTAEERHWCKQQIVSVEGYDERDAEGSDPDVARTVPMHGWITAATRGCYRGHADTAGEGRRANCANPSISAHSPRYKGVELRSDLR